MSRVPSCTRLRAWSLCLLLVGMLILVGACSRGGEAWALKDISGLMPELSFSLTDASTDADVQATDFRGKIVLLYFGYTHCPDVCPTTLTMLGQAVSALGSQAQEVRVLFVTVDPKRDSLTVLRRYAQAFGPEVVGLRGDPGALRALTKRYRVTYGYGKPDALGDYSVSHSSAVYVFDRRGAARLLMRPGDTAAALGGDLKRLLAEK